MSVQCSVRCSVQRIAECRVLTLLAGAPVELASCATSRVMFELFAGQSVAAEGVPLPDNHGLLTKPT